MIIDWSKTGYLIQTVAKGKESNRQREGQVGRDRQLEQNPSGIQGDFFFPDA